MDNFKVDFINKEKTEELFSDILEQKEKSLEDAVCDVAREVFQKTNYLGEGQSAIVYRDPLPDKKVAFKLVNQLTGVDNDLDVEAGFLEELENFHEKVTVPAPHVIVQHRSVLEIDGKKQIQNKRVLLMEEIVGTTLRDLSINKDKLPVDFSIETFFDDLEDFIKKMNTEKNIHHRDLHSGNIMIDYATGNPVVIDFGRSYTQFFSEDNPYRVMDTLKKEMHVFTPDIDYIAQHRKMYIPIFDK